MTTKGIIFSASMVRALLAGTKTQTRRLIKPIDMATVREGDVVVSWPADEAARTGAAFRPPYAPGDRLYVRETWKPHSMFAGMKPRDIPRSNVFFAADDRYAPSNTPWVPCIHMPRWASRLWLDVTEVRVQRLQDISEADAIAEGISFDTIPDGLVPGGHTSFGFPGYSGFATALSAYSALWNSLHTDPGTRWEDSPWVVAVTFTVHHGNVDQVQP